LYFKRNENEKMIEKIDKTNGQIKPKEMKQEEKQRDS